MGGLRLLLAAGHSLRVHPTRSPRPTAFLHPLHMLQCAGPMPHLKENPPPHPPAPPPPTLQQPPPDSHSGQQQGSSAGSTRGPDQVYHLPTLAQHPYHQVVGHYPGEHLPGAHPGLLGSTSWHRSSVQCFFSEKFFWFCLQLRRSVLRLKKEHGLTI